MDGASAYFAAGFQDCLVDVDGALRDDEIIFASYDVCFAAQMKYLNEGGYTTLDFDDYVAIRRGERSRMIAVDPGLCLYASGLP